MKAFSAVFFLVAITAVYGNPQSFQGGNFVVQWTHLAGASPEIEFNVTVKTAGWVGLGISKENDGMKKLDLFIGGVNGSTGAGYVKDYYVDAKKTPAQDASNDVTLLASSESGNYTNIRVKRKLDTGDASKDNIIKAGEQLYLAWAYGTSDTIGYHYANRGYSSLVTLVAITPSSSVAPTTMPKTTTAKPSNDKELKFQLGNYIVNWNYNSVAKEITFTVKVNGVGWIGLGISEINKGMEKMDVAVAMVNSSIGMVKDYYSNGKTKPEEDNIQDYIHIESSQQNGTTMVKFKRKLKTDDEKDVEIVVGKGYYIAWAFKKMEGSLDYHHSNRGYSTNKVVLAVKPENPTDTGACAKVSFTLLILSVLMAIFAR